MQPAAQSIPTFNYKNEKLSLRRIKWNSVVEVWFWNLLTGFCVFGDYNHLPIFVFYIQCTTLHFHLQVTSHTWNCLFNFRSGIK